MALLIQARHSCAMCSARGPSGLVQVTGALPPEDVSSAFFAALEDVQGQARGAGWILDQGAAGEDFCSARCAAAWDAARRGDSYGTGGPCPKT